MLKNERRICTFKLSTNKCYNDLIKSIEQILNVIFKHKPKKNARLLRHPKITYFHLECQNPTQKIKKKLTSLILLSKPLKCKLIIKKINLIILI
jgi:hypothetical protein